MRLERTVVVWKFRKRVPGHEITPAETDLTPPPLWGGGSTVQENCSFSDAVYLRAGYFGGVLESAGGGGVALPLLSGGGVVDGLD